MKLIPCLAFILTATAIGKTLTQAPTQANVAYGEHERQVPDFYQAKSDKPTPLM